MFFWLQEHFREAFGPLNVLRYVSFRTLAALLTALVTTMALYPPFIRLLHRLQIGESIRDDGPERHLQKSGTPTMGGLLIILTVLLCVLLWGNLGNGYVRYVALIFLGFGAVGFADDFAKLKGLMGRRGLPGKVRLLIEFAIVGLVMAAFLGGAGVEGAAPDVNLYIPFIRPDRFAVDLTVPVYGAFAALVIVGTANAVNLTDGLDGLAIGPSIVSAATFLILAYLAATQLGRFDLSAYLLLPRVPGAQELAIFAAAMVGAGIGFLWYNTFPASVFMGDVGALAIGAGLGALAVFTKNELLSAIIHGLFLVEVLSVVAQTTSFKLTGKRVFRMAPIHHHFELKGWAEPKIIVRFWIVSIMLALVALSSIKLR